MMVLPQKGVAICRIVTIYAKNPTLGDLYYVEDPKHVPPLLRKMWEMGFIPHWKWVCRVAYKDKIRGYIPVGDV
tara:strand:- start:10119 stop:10340 length:222 start_codon:yes stop_codon:yes gene_type:complete